MVDVASFLEKGFCEIERLNEKFRRDTECPKVDGCKYFSLHSKAKRDVAISGSRFGGIVVARRCMYQLEENRKSDFAPRGLETECVCKEDIGPSLSFECYAASH